MLILQLGPPSQIVRRGDKFSITLKITNKQPAQAMIQRIVLKTPYGFREISIKEESNEGKKVKSTWHRLNFSFNLGPVGAEFEYKPSPKGQEESRPSRATAAFFKKPIASLQTGDSFSAVFNLQVGRMWSLQPRPDTYQISANIEYSQNELSHTDTADTQISIYPTLSGMLIGAGIGGVMGTAVANYKSLSNLSTFVPILVVNTILSIVAGIVFMRKKSVQPFLTIEDFWGGIVLGFVIGYSGQLVFSKLTGLP
jgi:hypothetical protein